ncbi:unnamed protein product [Caenorhabditis angaria]|uniref:Uncharacterized protein n=1 Tax=Caenorhabditis angaria TaxID=860376 RepID=A0A9P1IMH7_9PELO|nr:unnamed protein product [Caenorhabditis angaria]
MQSQMLNLEIIVNADIEYLLFKNPKKIQPHKHSFPDFESQGVQLCCAEYFSSNVNSQRNWLIDCTITVQHNRYKLGQKSNSYVICSKQPSQNAAVPSNSQFSFSDASEQEDVSFRQDIQRVQQLLRERASQVSLF